MMYKSYSFVDKDPIIDYVRTAIQDSKEPLYKISEWSGVSTHTISNWLYGDTKRPQAASINAVLRVLGYKLEIVLIKTPAAIKATTYNPKPITPSAKIVKFKK